MKYKLQDLIDIEQFHYLQDRLNEIIPFPAAILDNDGNILTATAWQDICTQFHRKNKDCERECIQSDQYILSHLHEANPAVSYRCPRGLVDNATPIIIDGIHYGNFFTGQFFLEKPDMEFFRAQAKKYGFDEDAYLEAVKKVPIWSQEQLNSYIFFIKGLIAIISESGLKKLKEIETRKQIEESKERANTILRQMHDGFWMTNMQGGQIIDANDAMCRMLGYTRNEMLKMSAADVEANDSPEVIAQRIQHIIQSGSAHFESRFRRKDGTIIDVDVSVTYSPERNLFFSFHRDISERVRAEEAQHKAETNYRGIFENAPIGIYQSTPEGRYLSANPALACIYGHDSPEDMLTNITNIDSQIYVDPSFRHKFQRQLAEQGVVTEFVSENYRKDSSLIWTVTSARAVKDTQGQILYYEGYITDITERKRAEIQMQAVQAELQRLLAESNQSRRALLSVVEDQKRAEEEKAKLQEYLIQAQKMESVGRLAGGVAHDFNNLLGVIMGHAETALVKTTPHQAGYQDLQEIFKAAQRSADLTRQLLAFARKQTIRPMVLNLNDTVASMLKMLKRMIGEDIELIWRPGVELKPVKIDPSQVDQLLANLLVNARDAFSGEGQIMIETSNVTLNEADFAQYAGLVAGEYALLTVSDTGSGMDQETLSHLFEPFFTTKEVGKGTGLGLATVFGIVKQNNGNIYAASQPGKGTTFKIYLPSYDVEVLPASPVERSETRLEGTETILMVEDEEMLLELGQEALDKLGYVILAANTPAEALRIAQEYDGVIHLLITDVVMPGMNGKKLAEQLNLLQPGIKCLFMSGYTTDIIGDHGVLGEDVFFIQKPFLLTDLAAKARQVLEKGVIE